MIPLALASPAANSQPELVPAIFCAVGLVFVALGLALLTRQRRFARRAARTTGTVVELARRWSRSTWGGVGVTGNALYFPVVRFTTADGQAIQVQSSTGTSWRSCRVGQTVPVLFDPANPHDARIDTFLATGCLPTFFVAFGALFVALGVAILWVMQWWAHHGPPGS